MDQLEKLNELLHAVCDAGRDFTSDAPIVGRLELNNPAIGEYQYLVTMECAWEGRSLSGCMSVAVLRNFTAYKADFDTVAATVELSDQFHALRHDMRRAIRAVAERGQA